MACCLVCSRPAWCQAGDPPAVLTISAAELDRLLTISTRLAALNATLKTELDDSRKNSDGLAFSLESLTSEAERQKTELATLKSALGTLSAELATLRTELELSRTRSNELALIAANSETDLIGLKTALTEAESSLRNLTASFSDYEAAAEAEIARLERGSAFWERFGWAALLAAIGGWTAFLLTLLL